MTTIKRTVLNNELKKLVKITSSNNTTLPIIKGILVEYSNNIFKMSATDLATSIVTKCECETDLTTNESFVIDAKLFSDIISKTSSDIELNFKDENLEIKSGNSKFNIKAMGKKDDFPKINKDIKEKKSISFKSNILTNLVNKTIKFTSDDDTRPTLKGVNLILGNNKIIGVSLDGFRMAYYQAKIENEVELEMILDANALVNISRSIDSEDVVLHFGENSKTLEFDLGDTSVFTSTIEGQFFNFKDLLKPTDARTTITVNNKTLKDAVERASIIAKSANTVNPIVFSVKDKKIIVNTHNEMGKVVEVVEVGSIEGENVDYQIAFNSKYILDGINSVSSDDALFKLNGNLNPAYLIDKDNGFIYLVLPIRVKDTEEDTEEKAS